MLKRLLMIASALALSVLFMIQASAKEITIRGHLEKTVEAGGWLIIADTDEMTTKYLLLNAQRFQKESWFHAGAEVEAVGETKTGVMTIYQEGVPFEARTIRSLDGSGNETATVKPVTKMSARKRAAPSKRRRRARTLKSKQAHPILRRQ